MTENGCADFDIGAVYYNFPDYDELIGVTDVPDLGYFREELNEMLPAFNAVKNKFADKIRVAKKGDKIAIDEVALRRRGGSRLSCRRENARKGGQNKNVRRRADTKLDESFGC